MTVIAQGVRRILIVDDNQDIHQDIKNILVPTTAHDDLDTLLAGITGKAPPKQMYPVLQIDSAFQGDEAVDMVRQARLEERPYSLAYVDMRIPPGIDGLQTIKKLQMEDDRLQFVVITAYSDYSWQDISDCLVSKDNLLVVKKPFEAIEIRQTASALIQKWNIALKREELLAALAVQRDSLEEQVQERTEELKQTNRLLRKEIEERKKAEHQIRQHRDLLEKEVARRSARIVEQNNFLHTVINSLPHPFMVVNIADYTIAIANRATQDKGAGGLEGGKCYQYLHGLSRPCHEEGMQCPLQDIQQHDAPAVLEHSILDRQGNERVLEVHTHPVQGLQLGDEKTQTIEYCIDITRRKKLESASLKNSKMELVATLAGGIAHDFNNLLMAIVGNIELAAMNMSPDHNSAEFLDYATNASLQAKELTRKFLLFSNFDPPTRQAVPLDDLIIASCKAVIDGSDIVPKFHFSSDLWLSYVDPGQLDQALRELFVNAREAMGDKGELTLVAENITRSEQTHPERVEGKYIRITLQDQGRGIDAKNLANVFDPYFSSKIRGNGKGMGLGLTIASSIIHQHQGEIDITSTPGEGTTLHIELPAVTE